MPKLHSAAITLQANQVQLPALRTFGAHWSIAAAEGKHDTNACSCNLEPNQNVQMSKPNASNLSVKPTSCFTAHAAPRQDAQMTRLVLELIRPYRGWLVIVLAAMLAEIAMSLAAPWPLKLVLDDALGNHKLPDWLAWAHDYGIGRDTLGVALFAGLSTLFIAVVGAIATYIDNYYTASIGQWVANDLRIRIYAHLHELSLRFFDTAKT